MTHNAPERNRPAARLYSLVYTSESVHDVTDEQLADLLDRSRSFNETRNITGILLYRRGRFVQFLEGPEGEVRHLMETIRSDPRHTKMRLLIDGHPTHRQFEDWTMGYQPSLDTPTSTGTGFRDTFDDLEAIDDTDAVLRATRELTIWFRARSGVTADATL